MFHMDDYGVQQKEKIRLLYQNKFLSEACTPTQCCSANSSNIKRKNIPSQRIKEPRPFSVGAETPFPYKRCQRIFTERYSCEIKKETLDSKSIKNEEKSKHFEYAYLGVKKARSWIEQTKQFYRSLNPDWKSGRKKSKNSQNWSSMQSSLRSKHSNQAKIRYTLPSKRPSLIQMIMQNKTKGHKKIPATRIQNQASIKQSKKYSAKDQDKQKIQALTFYRNQRLKPYTKPNTICSYSSRQMMNLLPDTADKEIQINAWAIVETDY